MNALACLYRLALESYLIYNDRSIWFQMRVSVFSKLETQGTHRSEKRQLGKQMLTLGLKTVEEG